MRYIAASILILTIFGQAFVRTAWVLHYQWNRAVYMERCENKLKPSLHCNGKCLLRKKMLAEYASQDPAAPQLPDSFREIKDIQLFFEPLPALLTLADEAWQAVALPLYQMPVSDAPPVGVFRPPVV